LTSFTIIIAHKSQQLIAKTAKYELNIVKWDLEFHTPHDKQVANQGLKNYHPMTHSPCSSTTSRLKDRVTIKTSTIILQFESEDFLSVQ
jgi:hypothetical protein